MEYNEGRYLHAYASLGEINEASTRSRGATPFTQETDASTKRQDAERRGAQLRHRIDPMLRASVFRYFKSRQSEAKAERDGEGRIGRREGRSDHKTPAAAADAGFLGPAGFPGPEIEMELKEAVAMPTYILEGLH